VNVIIIVSAIVIIIVPSSVHQGPGPRSPDHCRLSLHGLDPCRRGRRLDHRCRDLNLRPDFDPPGCDCVDIFDVLSPATNLLLLVEAHLPLVRLDCPPCSILGSLGRVGSMTP